jgi:hypothetical protein
MDGSKEHMVKYLQAPHGNELDVESFPMVHIVRVLKFNDDGTRLWQNQSAWIIPAQVR